MGKEYENDKGTLGLENQGNNLEDMKQPPIQMSGDPIKPDTSGGSFPVPGSSSGGK